MLLNFLVFIFYASDKVIQCRNGFKNSLSTRHLKYYPTNVNQTWHAHTITAHCDTITRVQKVKAQGHTRSKIIWRGGLVEACESTSFSSCGDVIISHTSQLRPSAQLASATKEATQSWVARQKWRQRQKKV